MKSLTLSTGFFVKFFAGLLLIAVVSFGCQKENILPESTANNLQAYVAPPSFRTISPCGQSLFSSFQDGATSLGEVEVSNDASFVYVTIHMSPLSVMDQLQIFIGESSVLPVDGNGDLDITQFSYVQSFGTPTSDVTVVIPMGTLSGCPEVVVHSTITTQVANTMIFNTQDLFTTGTSMFNGQSNTFCLTICAGDDTTI